MTTVEVALLIGVGIGVVEVGLSWSGVLLSVPIVILTVANFCAMGILSAAIILLVKRGDPISGPLYQVTLLLSGAIFPVDLFPSWLQTLCLLNPAYYGVSALHEALLTDAGLSGILDELAVLAGFAAVGIPVSAWVFGRAVLQAKRLGILGNY